jgi:mono/diheme cytochrome c family protein
MRTRLLVSLLTAALICAAPSIARQNTKTWQALESWLERAPDSARSRPNPYAGDANAFLAGQKLFRRHCAACHGEDGGGSAWAPSLHSARIQEAPAGALVWFLRNGDLRAGMPSWSQMPEQRRWQIVTFLQEKR